MGLRAGYNKSDNSKSNFTILSKNNLSTTIRCRYKTTQMIFSRGSNGGGREPLQGQWLYAHCSSSPICHNGNLKQLISGVSDIRPCAGTGPCRACISLVSNWFSPASFSKAAAAPQLAFPQLPQRLCPAPFLPPPTFFSLGPS